MVGYADGVIHLTWKDKEATYQNHFEVVTAIHVVDHQVYASFYNGFITKFDLKTFRKDSDLFHFKDTVIDFQVEHTNLRVSI